MESADSSLLCLIDFSVSLPYMSKPLPKSQIKLSKDFNGNLAFSSKEQMMGLRKLLIILTQNIYLAPSRKDDIISTLYLLIYLQEGTLPWSGLKQDNELDDTFKKVRDIKKRFHSSLFSNGNCKNTLFYCVLDIVFIFN